ncbi:MAG: hypothetical protein NXI21_05205 [Alphaproteobacteria bacterium]|nr:hypothetical protein [Alphaproteobacteria bacterium]
MTAPETSPAHSQDFDRLYDLPDPRPYFRGLKPSAYRMPQTVAAAVEALRPALLAARGRPPDETLRLLDFACGYGTLGLLLRHDLTMDALYRRFADDGLEEDPAFFAARRLAGAPYEIAGLDIAGRAVAYARRVGAVDLGFSENVLDAAPGPELSGFLATCDLIVETGAIGGLLAPGFARLLEAAGDARPWMLYCPRPNVDPQPPRAVLEGFGYRVEAHGDPVAYRRPLSEVERAEVLRQGRALGLSDADVLDADGFMRVQIRLARPGS